VDISNGGLQLNQNWLASIQAQDRKRDAWLRFLKKSGVTADSIGYVLSCALRQPPPEQISQENWAWFLRQLADGRIHRPGFGNVGRSRLRQVLDN